MTTTELIALLSSQEHGGVTGQERKVNIYAKNQYGEEILVVGEDSVLNVVGGGDGVFGASLDLRVDTFFEDKSLYTIDELNTTNKILIERIHRLEAENDESRQTTREQQQLDTNTDKKVEGYIENLIFKNISPAISNDSKNPIKQAIINTIDELSCVFDEAFYRELRSHYKEIYVSGIDDYYSVFQLMLEIVSGLIGSGELHKRHTEVKRQNWCSWYTEIVVSAYANAIRDKFDYLTTGGNEFCGYHVKGEGGLNLSHLDEKYETQFNQ